MHKEDFFEEGMRAGRITISSKRRTVSFEKQVRRLRKSMKSTAGREKKGWLHDNDYLAHRAAAAFLPLYEEKHRLRTAGDKTCLERMIDAYLTIPNADLSPGKIAAFFDGVRKTGGLEEREVRMIRPLFALRLMKDLFEKKGEERAVNGLRLLLSAAWERRRTEELSDIAEVFREDAVYPLMDDASRRLWRQRAEALAVRHGVREKEEASLLMHRVKNENESLGRVLFPRYGEITHAWIALVLLPGLLSSMFAGLLYLRYGFLPACLLWPLFYEIAARVVPGILARQKKAEVLFGMDFRDGVPESEKTLTVITGLVKNEEDAKTLLADLEERWIAEGKDPLLPFGLLLDRQDEAEIDHEEEEKIASFLTDGLLKLKDKYGTPFYGFLRKRMWSEKDGVFRGFERKRGALSALTAALSAGGGMEGDLTGESLAGFRYLVTLDRDTIPWPGSIRKLCEKAAHPDNAPVVRGGRVVRGYAVFAPVLRFSPAATEATPFGEILSAGCGADLYGGHDNRDLFSLAGRGIFQGKGLLRVDTAASILPCAFPKGKILSHDLPEGGLLGTAAVSDAVFFEEVPKTAASFFARLHRWMRGDTQNLALFREKKLDLWTAWLIAENVRRLFLNPAILLALVAGFATGSVLLPILPGILLFWPFLKETASIAFYGGEYLEKSLTLRYSALGRSFLESALSLAVLPYEVFLSLDAFFRSGYRLLVSGKKLLEWSPFSEKNWTVGGCAARLLPPAVAASAACPYLAPVWLAGFAAVWRLSRTSPGRTPSGRDAAYLKCRTADTMDLFLQLCRREWGYLPADNLQLYPYNGITQITSPTDMGMTLLAFLAYDDMGLPGADRFLELGGKMLQTMEKLPKKWGLFYNWYSLPEQTPMQPKILSSVDSGNLAASLFAAAAAYREKGFPQYARPAEEMALGMEFDKLYDPETKLLSIGYDDEKHILLENRYDLYQSEARIASFLAVALGQVPAEHWLHLGRSVKTYRGYAGLASWSGTAFEALLPDLFFPSPRGTLAGEGGAFTVRMQKLAGERRGRPWGISESCFYAFDGKFSYRYKAHGVGKTALAPERVGEYVAAPYAAFLALGKDEQAVDNLRYEEELGAVGRYGFYDALDATDPGRIRPVRVYMSHHAGMLAAAANEFLSSGVTQRRLFSYPFVRAFRMLFWESAKHQPDAEEVSAESPPGKLGEGSGTRWLRCPEASADEKLTISDGRVSLLLSGDGRIESSDPVWNGLTLYCRSGNSRVNLTAYPYYDKENRETVFTEDAGLFGIKKEGVLLEARIAVKDKLLVTFTLFAEKRYGAEVTVGLLRSTGEKIEKSLVTDRNGVAQIALSPADAN